MLSLNKIVISIFFYLAVFGICMSEDRISQEVPNNVILIGWDGVAEEALKALLSQGRLPNLQKLINEGSFVKAGVTTGKTQTKPGWAEILTGYDSRELGIYNNRDYKAIPEGFTVFERLKSYFGNNGIVTIFIGGKQNNIGDRGQHEICSNCFSRDPVSRLKTYYWDKEFCNAKTFDGKEKIWIFREAEPYFNSKKSIDFHLIGLGEADKVGSKAILSIERYYNKRFFAFFHFEEPDEQGHVYGEGSLQYRKAMETVDLWLGRIVKTLQDLGIYEKTSIYVTSDHGMDKNGFEHRSAARMFLVSNNKRRLRNADRKDITPTILDELGLDLSVISPKLAGKSLFLKNEDAK